MRVKVVSKNNSLKRRGSKLFYVLIAVLIAKNTTVLNWIGLLGLIDTEFVNSFWERSYHV